MQCWLPLALNIYAKRGEIDAITADEDREEREEREWYHRLHDGD